VLSEDFCEPSRRSEEVTASALHDLNPLVKGECRCAGRRSALSTKARRVPLQQVEFIALRSAPIVRTREPSDADRDGLPDLVDHADHASGVAPGAIALHEAVLGYSGE